MRRKVQGGDFSTKKEGDVASGVRMPEVCKMVSDFAHRVEFRIVKKINKFI